MSRTRWAFVIAVLTSACGRTAQDVPLITPTGGVGYAIACRENRIDCLQRAAKLCDNHFHVLREHRSFRTEGRFVPQNVPHYDLNVGCGAPPRGYWPEVTVDEPPPLPAPSPVVLSLPPPDPGKRTGSAAHSNVFELDGQLLQLDGRECLGNAQCGLGHRCVGKLGARVCARVISDLDD